MAALTFNSSKLRMQTRQPQNNRETDASLSTKFEMMKTPAFAHSLVRSFNDIPSLAIHSEKSMLAFAVMNSIYFHFHTFLLCVLDDSSIRIFCALVSAHLAERV